MDLVCGGRLSHRTLGRRGICPWLCKGSWNVLHTPHKFAVTSALLLVPIPQFCSRLRRHGMAADDKTAADDTDGRRLLADDEQGEIDTVGTNGDKASIIEITPLAGANKHKNTGSAGNKGAFLLGSGNNSAGARGAMASEGARDEEEGGEEDGWVGGVGEGARATAGLSLSCLDREHSHDQSQGSGLSHRRHSRLSGVECNGNHEPHHGGAVVGGDEGGGEGIGCHEHHSCIPHDHDSENGGHGHGHSHDHSHCKGDWTEDTSMNIWAVFVHAVADAVSSAIVCAQGGWYYYRRCQKITLSIPSGKFNLGAKCKPYAGERGIICMQPIGYVYHAASPHA